jgi:hypothetical protein
MSFVSIEIILIIIFLLLRNETLFLLSVISVHWRLVVSSDSLLDNVFKLGICVEVDVGKLEG